MPKKKVTRKAKKPAANGSNVKPIGKQYKLSNEEMLTYQAFKAKFELADEKIKLATAEREMATFMRDSLYKNIVNRLSLSNKKINIHFDDSSVTVLGDAPKANPKSRAAGGK